MPLRTCSYCDRTFSKVEHLKRHERSHTGEKPYQCRKCNKRFSRGDVLNRHLKCHYQQRHGPKNNSQPPDSISRAPRHHSREAQSTAQRDATTPSSDQTASPTNSSQHSLPLAPNSPSGNDTASIAVDDNFDIDPLLLEVTTPLSSPSCNGPERGLSPVTTQDYQFAAPLNNPVGSSPTARQTNAEPRDLLSAPFPLMVIPENAIGHDDSLNSLSNKESNANEAVAANEGHGISYHAIDQDLGASLFSNRTLDQFLANHGSQIWKGPDIGEPEWLSALDPHLSMMGDQNIEHGSAPHREPNPLTRDPLSREPRLPVGSEIPADRFERVANLWPRIGEKPWKLIDTLWADVLSHSGDNLFSEAETSFPWLETSSSSTGQPQQGLDSEKRLSMAKEYGVSLDDSVEPTRNDMKFPGTEMLEMCIDRYFHRFHPLMPLFHKPTFSPQKAPNAILFPMCLIGLYLLNPGKTRGFVSNHLLKAMEKCYVSLSKPWSRTESIPLLTDLGSAILMLYCAATMEECVHAKQTYALYTKALSVAQENSLFELDKGTPLASVLVQGQMDDSTWRAWSRVETTKRVITCLIMIDSFFASNLGTSPIIRGETLQFHLPCSKSVFEALDANRWSQLQGYTLSKKSLVVDFRKNQVILKDELPSISVAIQTLLSAIWLRFSDLRHRLLLLPADAPPVNVVLFPGELYQKDASGAVLPPLLSQIYSSYRHELAQDNPNNLVFWHNMNIALMANFDLFEMAIGRDGHDAGKAALENISLWSQTACARRACLHAAQIYACMSRRRVTDGTMFLSERALFNSALVLGLYVFVSPTSLQQKDQQLKDTSQTTMELLNEMDWAELGGEGFPGLSEPHHNSGSAASRFIAEGGPISFAGVVYSGGYASSRKIFLEYIGLLEEIGRWNVDKYCRILRIVSDSVLDSESHE